MLVVIPYERCIELAALTVAEGDSKDG